MKSKNDEATQRVLLILKIDANNLFSRIKDRKSEYLEVFALRRTRTHFPTIFKNRYETTTVGDLAYCSTELISSLNQFYNRAEEMSWYLFQTQDMPSMVENFIDRSIRKMSSHLDTLNLFLDSELGIESGEKVIPEHEFLDQLVEPEAELFSDLPFGDTPEDA
jgi:hypothetical protein